MNRTPIQRGTALVPRFRPAHGGPAFALCRLLALLVVLLAGPALEAAELPQARPPGKSDGTTGTLVIVGGGKMPSSILDRFLELAGGRKARLVIIPTAADTSDHELIMDFWKSQPVASVDMLHTRSPKVANRSEFLRPLKQATAVWISGGDQSRLVEAYGGTEVERELRRLLVHGGVIGGTSAGAAVMSPLMIRGGYPRAEVGPGFGLMSGVVIDQHFSNRHRLVRLLGVLRVNPSYLGIGIDEQTAIIVTGHSLTVLGNAEVRLCVPAAGAVPASIEVLKTGQQAQLPRLFAAVLARTRPVKERAEARSSRPRRVEAARGDR